MEYVIRPEQPEDIEAACAVRIAAWRESYVGQVPQEMLDSLNLEQDVARNRARLTDPNNRTKVLVVEADGKIVGFAAYGPIREDKYPAQGEIYAIYLVNEGKGKGLGKKLMQAAAKDLLDQGITSACVHVLSTNKPAIEFYKSLGGVYVGEGSFTRAGAELKEDVYLWKDIRTLLPPAAPSPKTPRL